MNSFKVIPAMDLVDGRCVRLVRGDYNAMKIYPFDPVELAKSFLEKGLDMLHMVDLDGAREGSPANLSMVEAIASTGIMIEYGGGLRTKCHLQSAINSGATDLILGSRLLSDEMELQEWLSCFSGRLVAGIDARDGKVAIHGWQSTTEVKAVVMAKKVDSLGFSRIIYTDISRDGTLTGPNLSQLEMIARQASLPVIASGGVSGVKDIQAVKKLQSLGVKGVIVGKALYEGNITLEEMSQC